MKDADDVVGVEGGAEGLEIRLREGGEGDVGDEGAEGGVGGVDGGDGDGGHCFCGIGAWMRYSLGLKGMRGLGIFVKASSSR